MKISIFLVCYNEEILLPHTIRHYKKYLPSANFVLCDNYSSDSSRDIAHKMGCDILSWGDKEKLNELQLTHLKNNCWKFINDGWVIVCDMDEWLCVDEKFLKEEDDLGSTILETRGYNIVGESKLENLSDIDLFALHEGHRKGTGMDKAICFKCSDIKEINYSHGAHACSPQGKIKWGGPYLLKHMSWLGLSYKNKINKIKYNRSIEMREKHGLAIHYKKTEEELKEEYNFHLKERCNLKDLCECFS